MAIEKTKGGGPAETFMSRPPLSRGAKALLVTSVTLACLSTASFLATLVLSTDPLFWDAHRVDLLLGLILGGAAGGVVAGILFTGAIATLPEPRAPKELAPKPQPTPPNPAPLAPQPQPTLPKPVEAPTSLSGSERACLGLCVSFTLLLLVIAVTLSTLFNGEQPREAVWLTKTALPAMSLLTIALVLKALKEKDSPKERSENPGMTATTILLMASYIFYCLLPDAELTRGESLAVFTSFLGVGALTSLSAMWTKKKQGECSTNRMVVATFLLFMTLAISATLTTLMFHNFSPELTSIFTQVPLPLSLVIALLATWYCLKEEKSLHSQKV